MILRQVPKLQKTALIVILYIAMYLVISSALYPEEVAVFVRDELRVGDKYTLIFLEATTSAVFSDVEGATVFEARHCGQCFITNNKGFLPMSEYDAFLIHRTNFSGNQPELAAFIEPEKVYQIQTSNRCVENKLIGCYREPVVTAYCSKASYHLCQLCEVLAKKRGPKEH